MKKVFHNQPKITASDVLVYQDICSNWGNLNEYMLTRPSLENLKKVVLIEALGRKRPAIMDRLLARIYTMEKRETFRELMK